MGHLFVSLGANIKQWHW